MAVEMEMEHESVESFIARATTGTEGEVYVGATVVYFNKPTIDATAINDIIRNTYIAEQIDRLTNLLFIDAPTIKAIGPDGEEDGNVSALLNEIADAPEIDLWAKMRQAWVDIKEWGCALYNPVWARDGGSYNLVKLRRLPPESFGEAPSSSRPWTYSHILKGITLNKEGEIEFWQRTSDGRQTLLTNVLMLKDPASSDLAGTSILIPLVPIVRMLNFAWQAQIQKVNRVGAPIIFMQVINPVVDKINGRDDLAMAQKIIKNWGKNTSFSLPDNMKIVEVKFNESQSALETIQALERRIKASFSASAMIQKEGATIGGNAAAEVDLERELIKGQHNMIEGQFEHLLQEWLDANAFEGYVVEIDIPEPEPDRSQLELLQAKTGFDTQALTTNEIRERLGAPEMTDEEIAALAEEAKSRKPPAPTFPFGEAQTFMLPSRTVETFPKGGWTSPEPGDLPAKGARILAAAYAACRDAQVKRGVKDIEAEELKAKCAKIAWGAVHRAGFIQENNQWVKRKAFSYQAPDPKLERALEEQVAELEREVMKALEGEGE